MPPRQIREESWNSLHHSEASGDNLDEEYSDTSMNDESNHLGEDGVDVLPKWETVGDVHRALHPLQATADRVGKQVEHFAERLDALNSKKKRDGHIRAGDVLSLVKKYKGIARETVNHLEKMHAIERRQQLAKKTRRKFRNSSGQSTPRLDAADLGEEDGVMTTVEDLKFWEQEEQTWELLRLTLQIEIPEAELRTYQKDEDPKFVRPDKNIRVHHYSSEEEIWKSFLATDDQAWERHIVVRWLQNSADGLGQSIEEVVKELEAGADRGTGLWAHSWLFTKEAIKGQKRLNSSPGALDPDSPGLSASLLNSEKTHALVTQLDPDAITRQSRILEKQDQSFERAIWLACWEIVRRGKDWDYLREWCQQRVETWRAIAMRGDPRSTILKSNPPATWQSRALWRRTCALAAREGGVDEYENAVYGVLSGYLPSVLAISRSWDDYLFAHYNSYLLHSFDRFLRVHFEDRLPKALMDQHNSFNFSIFGGQRVQSGNQIIEKMKNTDAIKDEARSPIKMLQGSLIAKTFDDFVFRHGVRLSKSANANGVSKILTPMKDSILEESVTADFSMADHDLLRLVTHIILIYQDLGYDFGEGDRFDAMESIIVAYIDYLSKAGKQQLLPLYASRLSQERSITCLGRQLPFIRDAGERQTFLRLMAQGDIDVPAVLTTQLIMIITDTPASESDRYACDLAILERTRNDISAPRQIQNGFIGNDMTADQEDLVHGFEWFLLLEGHWRETMMVGAVVYKHLLRSQALAAAKAMAQEVSFSTISLSKTTKILGYSTDISNPSEDDIFENANHFAGPRYTRDHQRRRSLSLERIKSEEEMMLIQAKSFRDFENFFIAIDALEEWKEIADESMNDYDTRHSGRPWRSDFQKAYNDVESSIQPLLHDWLQDPKSDTEAIEFQRIRIACLPEVILAYITVLDFSSRFLSRDLLLKGMDLASVIAAEDSDVGTCFVSAGRMAELVECFACLSKTMIQADDLGMKSSISKRKKDGKTLGLWSIRASFPLGANGRMS